MFSGQVAARTMTHDVQIFTRNCLGASSLPNGSAVSRGMHPPAEADRVVYAALVTEAWPLPLSTRVWRVDEDPASPNAIGHVLRNRRRQGRGSLIADPTHRLQARNMPRSRSRAVGRLAASAWVQFYLPSTPGISLGQAAATDPLRHLVGWRSR